MLIGGRVVLDQPVWRRRIPVLFALNGERRWFERANNTVEAVNAMASYALRWGDSLNIAVGVADSAGAALSHALASAVGSIGKRGGSSEVPHRAKRRRPYRAGDSRLFHLSRRFPLTGARFVIWSALRAGASTLASSNQLR